MLATLVRPRVDVLALLYHLRITWWHRGIVVVDLVLIVVLTYRCFFPRGLKKAPAGARRAQSQVALGGGDGRLHSAGGRPHPARRLVIVPPGEMGWRALAFLLR